MLQGAGSNNVTSFLQVPQRPQEAVGQLAPHVEDGSHAAAGLVTVLHLGAELVHHVPHGDLVLRRLQKHEDTAEAGGRAGHSGCVPSLTHPLGELVGLVVLPHELQHVLHRPGVGGLAVEVHTHESSHPGQQAWDFLQVLASVSHTVGPGVVHQENAGRRRSTRMYSMSGCFI